MGIFCFYLFYILNGHLERNFFHPVPSNIGNSSSKLSILFKFVNFSKFLNLFYPVPSNIGNSSSQFSNCAWGVDFPLTLCSRGICLILCTLQTTFEHLAREEHFFHKKMNIFSTGRGWNGCWDQYLLRFIGGRCFARSMEVLRRRRGWHSCGKMKIRERKSVGQRSRRLVRP